MVDSWSRAPDQIQMYPDRDTIAQLLPARRLCLFFLHDCLEESLNTAISNNVVGSKHKARRQDRKVMWDKFIKTSYVLLARTVKILRWRAIWMKEIPGNQVDEVVAVSRMASLGVRPYCRTRKHQ